LMSLPEWGGRETTAFPLAYNGGAKKERLLS
jgi:hypothetical protein